VGTKNQTGITEQNSQLQPKPVRRKGPLFTGMEHHKPGTPNGKKPRIQGRTQEHLAKEMYETLQDYYDPQCREMMIRAGLHPPSLLPTTEDNSTPKQQQGHTQTPAIKTPTEPTTPTERNTNHFAVNGISENKSEENKQCLEKGQTNTQTKGEQAPTPIGNTGSKKAKTPHAELEQEQQTEDNHTRNNTEGESETKTTTEPKPQRRKQQVENQ